MKWWKKGSKLKNRDYPALIHNEKEFHVVEMRFSLIKNEK